MVTKTDKKSEQTPAEKLKAAQDNYVYLVKNRSKNPTAEDKKRIETALQAKRMAALEVRGK